MGNREYEVLGTYTVENYRDAHTLTFISFKSTAYKIIIHVVVQNLAEVTEKHSNKQNLFSKNTDFFQLVFFKHSEG